jgi:hypothetical protein
MIGTESGLGKCRLSCNACEECGENDIACKSRNRVRLGYLPMEDMLG